MALQATIGGDGTLFVGEDKTFRYENINPAGAPVDMSGWTLLFDVRLKDNSAPPAIISKTPVISGTFDPDRTLNAQRATVILMDTDLNLFKAKTYRHSWKRMDDGSETVLAWGDFILEKATAP